MNAASPEPAPAYLQLRQRIIHLKPAELGIMPSSDLLHVWGVLMETGYEVGTATLVCLADGTTSLYYSTGGGMIGSGQYRPMAQASKALVAEAERRIERMNPTEDYPLPGIGEVRIYFLTYTGMLFAQATESDLISNANPLRPLYQRAQDTLRQLRALSEEKRK